VVRPSRAGDFPYFDNDGRPLALAHRGGSLNGEAPQLENTVAAFQVAVDLGYRYVETDVHATRDGVLVAFHDPSLRRTTGAEGLIRNLTYADLASIRIGGREAIPRLSDLFETWPSLRFNIDAKSPASVPPLARAVHDHNVWDRVCLASFSAVQLHRLRRLLGPRVATSYSVLGATALRLLPTARLRRLAVGAVGQAAQVPARRGAFEVVTPAFLDHAHALGKQVHVWTVNEADQMNRLLDLGVDGLVTDRIDTLRDVYRSRGVWTDTPTAGGRLTGAG
jgi:glycerophosphoryl diester phosphodiesterase